MEAFEILIIIVSVTLTIFLVALTILVVMGITLVKKLKQAADTAEDAAENVREFATKFRSATSMAGTGAAIVEFFKVLKKGKK